MNTNTETETVYTRNTAKNPLTPEQIERRNWEVVDFDHMPVKVATEMLCAPKGKMSNRLRKACMRSRVRIFQAVEQPKAEFEQIGRRVSGLSFSQLNDWHDRAGKRLRRIKRKFDSLPTTGTPQMMAQTNRVRKHLDELSTTCQAWQYMIEAQIKAINGVATAEAGAQHENILGVKFTRAFSKVQGKRIIGRRWLATRH